MTMKKSFILFPLAVSVSLALSGCSSSSSSSSDGAEVANVNSNGISSTTALPSWQATDSIQSVEMPASMASAPPRTIEQNTAYNNQTAYTQPVNSVPQQPVVQTPVQSAPSYTSESGAGSNMIGNCRVVRDALGAPVYAEITKGCYTDSSYTVGKSDTMYLISYLTGQTPAQIAALNNLSVESKLHVGQILRVR
ncbi:LysM peptidoglycan-binding domain-containing protein [Actinobacillus pleuropneumoniae]|nr:LysM peptidoglycan-binding domain-containing protein [Actinobacillus pleuropneumoniae]EFN01716.1 hypothetical protein appser13_20250 [Actinobacillus pleuropneumoniae serovar 13 str. N273]MCL7725079.1 LysM peptidoglycan-binding domain-containing protein [Actinobacillus pleuropneumoniae]MCL7738495.1 LysM peptidoglycan-binding domain-containing protein [Actinobacillus pleuropneumoniae]